MVVIELYDVDNPASIERISHYLKFNSFYLYLQGIYFERLLSYDTVWDTLRSSTFSSPILKGYRLNTHHMYHPVISHAGRFFPPLDFFLQRLVINTPNKTTVIEIRKRHENYKSMPTCLFLYMVQDV